MSDFPAVPQPRTSIEKVTALAEEARNLKAETPEQVIIFNLLPMIVPQVLALLPEDPAELDELIERAQVFVASLVSD